MGRSGAGKSTVVNLLLRLYDLESGRILIDGQDIAGVTQDSLRRHVGMVTQDTSLLHRSVRDNITYGRPEATDAEMLRAAERAEAHDFIAGLTDPKGRKGYDAHVGERGVKLSGRPAPARGHRPRDAEGRAHPAAGRGHQRPGQRGRGRHPGKPVPADGRQDRGGDCAPAVDHHAAMDRLVVMDQGRIVEMGDHASLLAAGGIYARLWAHQSGGFLGEDARRRRTAGGAPSSADQPAAVASRLRRSTAGFWCRTCRAGSSVRCRRSRCGGRWLSCG